MQSPPIKRLPVWSRPLRICHWAMTLAGLVLLLTGWLYLGAALLMAALAARLWLLFAGGSGEHYNSLLPNRHRLGQALEVLRSYDWDRRWKCYAATSPWGSCPCPAGTPTIPSGHPSTCCCSPCWRCRSARGCCC